MDSQPSSTKPAPAPCAFSEPGSAVAGKNSLRNHRISHQLHLQNVNLHQSTEPEQVVTGTLHPLPAVTASVYEEELQTIFRSCLDT